MRAILAYISITGLLLLLLLLRSVQLLWFPIVAAPRGPVKCIGTLSTVVTLRTWQRGCSAPTMALAAAVAAIPC